jgi:UDP-N-acetylmuramate dehydrogenase
LVPFDRPREHVSLAPFTTLGIGGPARWFARATRVEHILTASGWHGGPLFLLGGGSNLVVADEGFNGLVLQMSIAGVDATMAGGDVIVSAGAGESWDMLVEFAVKRDLAGIECLSGIPGTVGGTPIQNVGAYGQEVASVIEWVAAFDRTKGGTVRLSQAECGFAYRMSRFKREDADRFVISQVAFRLRPGTPANVTYPDLQEHLSRQNINSPTLANVRDAVLHIRRRKGMVINAADPDTRSVGSFFMNPVLDRAMFERVASSSSGVDALASPKPRNGEAGTGPRMPHYPMENEAVKIPAAWLIEQSGFARGHVEGAVGLSTKHPLAIINRGGATARDVLRFARRIKTTVHVRFGINLRPEPVFVGFAPDDPDVAFLTS